LIATRLDHRRRRIQFVQKEDALAILRQEIRSGPFRPAIASEKRQASQIHWVEQERPDILELYFKRSGNLGYHATFPRSRAAP
jgi:hypothetical protein